MQQQHTQQQHMQQQQMQQQQMQQQQMPQQQMPHKNVGGSDLAASMAAIFSSSSSSTVASSDRDFTFGMDTRSKRLDFEFQQDAQTQGGNITFVEGDVQAECGTNSNATPNPTINRKHQQPQRAAVKPPQMDKKLSGVYGNCNATFNRSGSGNNRQSTKSSSSSSSSNTGDVISSRSQAEHSIAQAKWRQDLENTRRRALAAAEGA